MKDFFFESQRIVRRGPSLGCLAARRSAALALDLPRNIVHADRGTPAFLFFFFSPPNALGGESLSLLSSVPNLSGVLPFPCLHARDNSLQRATP